MEWLQRCYRSKWRLTTDPNHLRDGFYYFSPPGTPHYPGMHLLGSKIWTSDERIDTPQLGEWEGGMSYVDGRPPARLPLAVIVGEPDCIEHGFKGPIRTESGHSAFCDEILPPPCYAPVESVFAKTNVLDCVFAFHSARIIALAYEDLAAAAAAAQALLGAEATVHSFPQPNRLVPASIVATIGNTTVLWLTGTTNYQQAALQAFYSGLGPRNQGVYSTTDLYEETSLAIAATVNGAGAGTSARFVLVGHSYGGAVAMVLAAKMLLANANRPVELLTLGAPSAGDDRLIAILGATFARHYVNADDPVPYLPPQGVIFALLVPILGALIIAEWSQFDRPRQRVMITKDGHFQNTTNEVYPDELIYTVGILIAQGRTAPRFIAHNAAKYREAICRACACVAKPCESAATAALGFDIVVEGLFFTRFGVQERLDMSMNLVPYADLTSWSYGDATGPKVLLRATMSEFGDYESFELFVYASEDGNIYARFTWNFDGPRVLLGIDTDEPPTIASLDPAATVDSFTRLVLVPSSVPFPVIDGNAPIPPPAPIYDGVFP